MMSAERQTHDSTTSSTTPMPTHRENASAPPSVHNILLLSESPEVARRFLDDVKGVLNRSKRERARPAFIHEHQRGIVLVDSDQLCPLQISHERQLSTEYLRMMPRVIVLVSRDRCVAQGMSLLSKAQRSALSEISTSSVDDIEVVLCLEGEPEEKLIRDCEKRARDELISSLGRTHSSVIYWSSLLPRHRTLYQRLKRSQQSVNLTNSGLGRISITHIFEGYRRHHTPTSRGGLLIQALVREGEVREGDQVEVVGSRCRVRSEVRRIERWREQIKEARSGEIITLILDHVLFTEVELGDDIYVTSSADQRASMQERLEHRCAHWGWSEEDRYEYESAVEMGFSLRQLIRLDDSEFHQQCLELVASLDTELSEGEVVAFRETLGGLIIRNPKWSYFTPDLTRFISGGDSTFLTSLRISIMQLVCREIDYDQITDPHLYSYIALVYEREEPGCELNIVNIKLDASLDKFLAQVISPSQPMTALVRCLRDSDLETLHRLYAEGLSSYKWMVHGSPQCVMHRLKSDHELHIRLTPHLLAIPDLFDVVITEPRAFTSLKVVKMRESGALETQCQRLSQLIARLPNLSEIKLDQAVTHELWVALQPYEQLKVLLGDPSESYAQGVSYGEKMRSLLSAADHVVVCQALELGMRPEGCEHGVFDELHDLLEGGDPSTLRAGPNLKALIARGASVGFMEAVYAVLLKVTGRLREVRSLRLRCYPELEMIGIYDELSLIQELELHHSDQLSQITNFSSFKRIKINHIKSLRSLTQLLMCDDLKSLDVQLSINDLLDLAHHPELLSLLEEKSEVLVPLDPDRSHMIEHIRDRLAQAQLSQEVTTRLMALSHLVGYDRFEVEDVGFRMVYCPAGELDVVSFRNPNFQIAKPFWIGQTQVTQELWVKVMRSNPSHFKGDKLPVENVSWFDCVRFCNALSELTGLEPVYDIGSVNTPTVRLRLGRTGYRLPSEVEWEYLAKYDHHLYPYQEVAAWYAVDSTQAVGQLSPNSLGIYDLIGNVHEWCNDQWDDTSDRNRIPQTRDPHEWVDSVAPRVYRGGSWQEDEWSWSVDHRKLRSGIDADQRRSDLGFRLLRLSSCGVDDELRQTREPELYHSDQLAQIMDLSQLRRIKIAHHKGLSSLKQLLMCDALESLDVRLSTEDLMDLAHHPELLTLLEEKSEVSDLRGHYRSYTHELIQERLAQSVLSQEMANRLTALAHLVAYDRFAVKGIAFNMVYCSAGQFWMGPDDQSRNHPHSSWCQPRHQVEITEPFWIGQTQVTQAQWSAIMGNNPSHFKGAHLPVEQVSWLDCVRFCNTLSESTGLEPVYEIGSGDGLAVHVHLDRTGYRLPTEAEWEYMAKAGTELDYAGSDDLNEVAWHSENSDHKTQPVGRKNPNQFGIYDCSGNVSEWCSDRWNPYVYQGRTSLTCDPHEWASFDAPRIIRGGGWANVDFACQTTYRSGYRADNRRYHRGFRLLRLVES